MSARAGCGALVALRIGGLALAPGLAACHRDPSTISSEPPQTVLEHLRQRGHAVDASLGGGAVRYLGFEALPEGAYPGDEITLVHHWVAVRPIPDALRVFVHFAVQGAGGWVPHADHEPIPGTDQWPLGKVVRDEHAVPLPLELPGPAVTVFVGLYQGERRLPVDPDFDDGASRIRAGSFRISAPPAELPRAVAPRRAAPPVLDGVLGEGEWPAPAIVAFTPASGRGQPAQATRVRLGWDPERLYLAFECDDPDILASLSERDAPVYKEEAVEMFLAQDLARGDYVELQSSPRGVLFDAAFKGGARRGMNVGFDARYTVAVGLDGTVDVPEGEPPDRDRAWRVEWAIDAASLGIPTPLAAGKELRLNFFRVGKDRVGGQLRPDESAWSAPLMGDFHNLERFGTAVLVE